MSGARVRVKRVLRVVVTVGLVWGWSLLHHGSLMLFHG